MKLTLLTIVLALVGLASAQPYTCHATGELPLGSGTGIHCPVIPPTWVAYYAADDLITLVYTPNGSRWKYPIRLGYKSQRVCTRDASGEHCARVWEGWEWFDNRMGQTVINLQLEAN